MKNYNTMLSGKQKKMSTLSSGKTDQYEYLTHEEILLPDKVAQVKSLMLNK